MWTFESVRLHSDMFSQRKKQRFLTLSGLLAAVSMYWVNKVSDIQMAGVKSPVVKGIKAMKHVMTMVHVFPPTSWN